eukprot:6610792-Alexandrium_andersonii.AAC.1
MELPERGEQARGSADVDMRIIRPDSPLCSACDAQLGGPSVASGEEPVFCPACGAIVDLARAVQAGMSAGWGPETATLVADHIASLAELIRAMPPAHIARRAAGQGWTCTCLHAYTGGRAARQPHCTATKPVHPGHTRDTGGST